ncbi:AraC family transcriptional regulator [Paenibacillus contaminans]|nr:AraC family transcriptional regulator [Paenibacillus contaminans]
MERFDSSILWNHVFIKILDIRHVKLDFGEHIRGYRLPADAFLCVSRGCASLQLGGVFSGAKRFDILHGGKGLHLDITPDEWFEYYMILYRAILPLPARPELVRLMENGNPFQLPGCLAPPYPISLHKKVEHMHNAWQRPDAFVKLHVKSLFYQFLYELTEQTHGQGAAANKPDLVSQAIRLIEEEYKEQLTLESIADMLDCSSRQLLRLFKSQADTTPIDYLIRVRMNKAMELLLDSDTGLKEIAESVGYADSYYFSRLFKKVVGISPIRFKDEAYRTKALRNNPSLLSRYPIVADRLRSYIDNDHENDYQYNGEGEFSMHRRSISMVAATLLFCFALLLSACSGGTSQTSQGGTASPSENKTAAPTAAASAAPEAPRVVKHAMGEVTLTGTPKRVVILTNEGTEALLAVGIKPVGAVKSWIGDPWYNHIKDDMKDVTVVGDEMQPNLELIASLKPDLIIGNKVRQEKVYEQLKGIAPTVFSEDLGGDWKTNFKLYMEATNKKEEGDKAMAAFDKRVAEVKAKLGSKAANQISVARFSATQVRIYQKQTFSGVLLNQLGFARPDSQNKDGNIEVMTKERIPELDGDVLFYFVTEAAGKTDASKVVQEWMNDPLFKNLRAVQNGKVKQVDEAIWNSAGGYEAANLLLDELVTYFDIK